MALLMYGEPLAWTIDYSDTSLRQLKRMDKDTARRILDYMDKRIARSADPRSHGKALSGVLGDLWRYRVGDYRILCDIQDFQIHILVVQIG